MEWSTMYLDQSSRIPGIFLGKLQSLSPMRASAQWIARDGLVPLLSFFLRFSRPEAGFAAKLYVHEKWLSFIPKAWRKHCESYVVGSSPTSDLFEEALPLQKRKRWITATYLSPSFCSVEHVASVMNEIRTDPRLASVCRHGKLMALLELGHKCPSYLFRFQRILNSVLRGEFAACEYHMMKHYSDFKDSVILDLNERLLCADDAHIHIMLARGAVIPHKEPWPRRKTKFDRISPYHGYFLAPLPERLPTAFDDPKLLEFIRYLDTIPAAKNPLWIKPPFGDVPHWILSFAQARGWLERP
jgi:hypothetical protein